MKPGFKPTIFILDVDGVLTTGHFLYTITGKSMKIFGPDDNDALAILANKLQIHFVTGDRRTTVSLVLMNCINKRVHYPLVMDTFNTSS